ncbi:MAG: glycosyltransferase, partial [Rhodoferax sp.]
MHTISNTLCQALRQRGWSIRELALNQCGWRQRLTAARQCDVLLASHNFRPAYLAWVIGLLLRKPILVWVHGPLQEVLAQAHASAFKRLWLRCLYRRVPYFVFVSRASHDSFLRFMQRPLAAHQRSFVIANAVEQTEVVNTAQLELATVTDPQLAYIGRLSPEKQPALLLDVLRLLPPRFRLTLVGDGPLRDDLFQNGVELMVDERLTLAGPQPHGAGLYAPWHMTLLASRYEGCPMMLLESFAAGVPCIGLP